ncbi:unnamed protein product [Candidula unifasciata]|uniref:Major facilitator superfamily (MFS) profile domain-containing protein n=1 Tax=Candidula unifasciata TaxID=100452 RepID=A0A8S3ZIY7_9EUPU|nr:unnamed protein product [Candidula unifasciata]
MASLKVRKRLMYLVFACIFIFGGVEYAVILPTLWLYLSTVYKAPDYMLGLVLSAYSLAAMFSAPLIGRLSDRIGCSKQIFIVCAAFELAGSFLYFIEVSQWLCLASRFVSGMGAASEAVAIAEVSRYTPEKDRTAIISYLVSMRQIALLIGPGLNAFLRLANFKIGPFEVNKYSAPGAFMVVVWGLLIVIVLLLYTEPRQIYMQDMQQTFAVGNEQVPVSDSTAVEDGENIHLEDDRNIETFEHPDNSGHETASKPITVPSDCYFLEKPASSDRIHESDLLQSGDETPFEFPPLSFHSCRNQEDMDSDAFKSTAVCTNSSCGTDFLSADFQNVQQSLQHDPPCEVSEVASINSDSHFCNTLHTSSSLDLLMYAERIIHDSQYFKTQMDEDDDGGDTGLIFDEDHFGLSAEVFGNNLVFSDNEKSPLLQRHQRRGSQTSLFRSYGANGEYIERSTSCWNDPVTIEGKLGFFCNEYIRDEIIAIIWLLFCAMFSQMCVETMVLPLTQKYLDFDELENSILYCACGVVIIICFLLVSKLSSRLSDRVMMMFGAVVILSSNVWLICFLPNAPPGNRSHNIPIFAVAVFLDVLSLPFLIVCATSLYSKLTRKQTQGLSQGLRRGIVGLGTVMAPLWGSSAVSKPYLLLGVLLALQGLSLIFCAMSYKRFKVPEAPALASSAAASPPVRSATRAANNSPPNVASLTSGSHTHQPQQKSQPAHSTSYGSIQVSFADSSYRSLDGSTEHQPLFSRPEV